MGDTPLRSVAASKDGTAVLYATNIAAKGDSDRLQKPVKDLRRLFRDRPPRLEAKVTGPAGYSTDAVEVFNDINGTLLYATAALVFFLLILIYRSPIFWFIPLFSVGLAEITARGLGYGLAEAGVTITGQSAGVLPVLVFGAGTDYALLLVARYREELRKHEAKQEAMVLALDRAGPAIVASGITVVIALLCLVFAEVNGTSGLGPIGALGSASR